MKYPKAVIKECKPEVKQGEVVIDECRLVDLDGFQPIKSTTDGSIVADMSACKGRILLMDDFDYSIGDDNGCLYLFVTKKENN